MNHYRGSTLYNANNKIKGMEKKMLILRTSAETDYVTMKQVNLPQPKHCH